MRRIKYRDSENKKVYVFLTNNFELPALTIAQLYKARWQVELFFKWVKQNLHIESFFGQSENAVKVQIWVAIAAYLLIAIYKKDVKMEAPLSEILHFLSGLLFEQIHVPSLFHRANYKTQSRDSPKQLSLLGCSTGH